MHMNASQQLALDLWKSTLEAHDRQWGHYVVMAFGVLAFLATVRDPHLAPTLLRRSLFGGVVVFMLVSVVSMWQNLIIHNDATAAMKADNDFQASPALASVGEMSPLVNTVVHAAFDAGLLLILAASLFTRSGPAARQARAGAPD